MKSSLNLRGWLWLSLLTIVLCAHNIRHYFWFRYAKTQKRQAYLLAAMVFSSFKDIKGIDSVSVGFLPRPGHTDCELHKIVWEAPVAIALWGNENPLFGISLELKPGIIEIVQLQGVSGVRLKDICPDWTARLVQACIRFARIAGIEQVRLLHADSRLSYYVPHFSGPVANREEAITNLRRRLRIIYDGTARKLGMKRKKRWSEWP